MKRIIFGVISLTTSVVSFSQTQGVQIYGLLDAGITALSNVKGSKNFIVDTGVQQANRLGFRGTEDLGGGNKALFTLESGFSIDTGALGQGGLLFGRQAYVGVSTPIMAVTVGRQYDFMGQYLPKYATAAYIGGLYAWHLGNVDRIAGTQMNNSVKFESENFDGLTFGAIYGFGESAGNFNYGSGLSAGISYANGPLNVGVAYTKINNATIPMYSNLGLTSFNNVSTLNGFSTSLDKTTNLGAGASYLLGKTAIHVLYTSTQFTTGAASSTLRIYEAGLNYSITPQLQIGGGYARSMLSKVYWNEFTAGLDYFLSKQTDIYLTANMIKATGPDVVAVLPTQTPSSTGSQTALRIGIRTKF